MKKIKKNKFILVAGLGICALSCSWSAAESDFGFESKRVASKPKVEGVPKALKRKVTTPYAAGCADAYEAQAPVIKSARSQPSPMDVSVLPSPFSIVSPFARFNLRVDEVLRVQGDYSVFEFLSAEVPAVSVQNPDLSIMEVDCEANAGVKVKGKAKSRIANSSPVPFSAAEGYEGFADPASDTYGFTAPAAPRKKKEDRTRGVPFPSLDASVDASVSEEMAGMTLGFLQEKK